MPALILGGIWAAFLSMAKSDIGFFAKRWYIPTYLILTFMLVPKTTIQIKDDVDPSFGFDTVSNIPVGLALVAGISSELSSNMTILIEDVLGGSDLLRFSKTGYGFSSRLVAEARTLRISDPTFLENVKDWTHQCIWLPYLKSNIQGKREAARTAQDLLSWVEENGHPSLGTYWRGTDGSKTYQTCRASAPLIREAFAIEEASGFSTLLTRLFGFSGLGEENLMSEKFKPYMLGAWHLIGKNTEKAANQIQQIMIVNALKEGFDDGRERFGYTRLHPELVSINAARSLEVQGMTGLIKGVSASLSLPLIQAFLVGLLSLLFFLVIPFSFMPGGIGFLSLWAKMLFAVQMWPVFGTILNAISVLWMARAADSVLMGGSGFTIATTTGLADAAGSVAGWSSGLQLLVPALSWAFVSKSGHFLTTVFQSAGASLEGSASRFASDTVDGNVSLNNLSLMNKNLSTESVAQQTLGMNQNFGSSVNIGDRSVVTGLSGQSFVHQNISALKTSFSKGDSLAASLNNSIRDSQSLTEQQSMHFQKALSDTSSNLTAYAEKLAKNTSITHGVSQADQDSIQKTAEETMSLLESMRKNHNLNTNTLVHASLSAGFKLGRLINIGAGTTASAQDQEALDKVMGTDEGRRLSANFVKLAQFAQDQRGQIMDSSGSDATTSLQSSLAHLQSASDSFNRSHTRSKNLENVKNKVENHSFGSTTNENDAWLSYVSQEKGFSKADAIDFLDNNPGEAHSLASDFWASKKTAIETFVKGADHIYTASEINDFLNKNKAIINPTGRDVYSKIEGAQFATEGQIDQSIDDMKTRHSSFYEQNRETREKIKGNISEKNKNLNGIFSSEKGKPNLIRVADKVGRDTKAPWDNLEEK